MLKPFVARRGIDQEMLILPVLTLIVSMTGIDLSAVVGHDSESLVITSDCNIPHHAMPCHAMQ